MNIQYNVLDYTNEDELITAARIHESAPLNWDPTWRVEEKRVLETVERIKKLQIENPQFLLFAKDEKKIIGFHWLRFYERDFTKLIHIDSLWVDENYRRHGIGSELKIRGENWAKNLGAKAVTTNVFYNNKRMLEFNLKLGFTPSTVNMRKEL